MSLRLKLKCRRVMPRVFFAGGRLGGDPAPDENEGPINSLSMSVVRSTWTWEARAIIGSQLSGRTSEAT